MAIHRKRFRVEEAIVGEMPSPEMIEEAAPMHSEIIAELRAILAQMAKGKGAWLTACFRVDPPDSQSSSGCERRVKFLWSRKTRE